jgi:hypothetical protein
MRAHSSHSSSSVQGYLANQRFGGPRQSEAEQMMQQKRRAAAQREKELRNYHQEQQYNRSEYPRMKYQGYTADNVKIFPAQKRTPIAR